MLPTFMYTVGYNNSVSHAYNGWQSVLHGACHLAVSISGCAAAHWFSAAVRDIAECHINIENAHSLSTLNHRLYESHN